MGLQQLITTTQFYLFGRSRFTATGWEKAAKRYVASDLEGDLTGKVFCVTGANSGIGKETASYLASKGAKVYMVCRSKERAEKAREDMGRKDLLEVLVGDVSSAKDTARVAAELTKREAKLDGLVCNAGALLNEKTTTSEGVEVTFASHLAFGSYLLSRELLPLLEKADDPRVVFTTSGGMYNSKFPGVEQCVDPPKDSYDGNFAYTYAKRGQVLLAEALAARAAKEKSSKVAYVSSHPGWTATPAVDAAYGDQKKYLEPMRNTWQGAEGQIWLCVVPSSTLEPGALYLDRTTQRKHVAGPFFTDGWATKNSQADVDAMLADLDALCSKLLAP